MKEYYIYKIICLMDDWNGKFYIGKHYGSVNDNYTGSGRLIKEYFSKYEKIKGLTYDKQILEVGDENSICDLERDYIRKGQQSELCLNIKCISGKGTFGQKGITPWNKGKMGCFSEETKQKMRKHISESHKGMKHSEETKHKMSEAAKRRWNKK